MKPCTRFLLCESNNAGVKHHVHSRVSCHLRRIQNFIFHYFLKNDKTSKNFVQDSVSRITENVKEQGRDFGLRFSLKHRGMALLLLKPNNIL